MKRNLLMAIVITTGSVLGVGCASLPSSNSDLSAHQGPLLRSSPTIQVLSLNGKEVASGFIGQKSTYPMKPGMQTAVVQYADLFELGSGDHETIRSNKLKITFSLPDQGEYEVGHPDIQGLAASEAFAKDPKIEIRSLKTGDRLNVELERSIPKSALSGLQFESQPEQIFASDYTAAPKKGAPTVDNLHEVGDVEVMNNLKKLWQKASPEMQKKMRDWVSQQP